VTVYTSVFQPFCFSGTLRKCDDHSRNPMQRSANPCSVVGEVEVSAGSGAKPPKADKKAAGKIFVKFGRIK